MQIATMDEARALVGRTFQKDGIVRRITALGEWLYEYEWGIGGVQMRANGTVSEMERWLSGASEIVGA